jgi:glycerate kinase
MMAYFNADLRPGVDLVIDAVRFRHRLVGADLCITGEGKLDASSLAGKTAIGIARACRDANVPCIALVGAIGQGARAAYDEGLNAYFSICDGPMTLDEAMRNVRELLAAGAENIVRINAKR